MARYEKPEDPRKMSLRERRQRRQRGDSQESIPWLWLGMGIVVTALGIYLAINLANSFLIREPIAVTLPTPTIIRLTAPPSVAPSPTVTRGVPTVIPTVTAAPTLDVSSPPDEITVGFYGVVVNTNDNGVTVRGGPSTDNARLLTAAEGRVLLIIGGPEENGDFVWWQVRLDDGTEGWIAGTFLASAPAP